MKRFDKPFLRRLQCLSCLVFGIVGEILLLPMTFEALSGLRYPATKGTVISSCVESTDAVCWKRRRPKIAYTYQITGRSYQNHQYSILPDEDGMKEWAEDVVARYPVGAECQVFYDPANPQKSFLTKSVQPLSLFLVAFLIVAFPVFIAIGLYGGFGDDIGEGVTRRYVKRKPWFA